LNSSKEKKKENETAITNRNKQQKNQNKSIKRTLVSCSTPEKIIEKIFVYTK